jgi:hypothetical protein
VVTLPHWQVVNLPHWQVANLPHYSATTSDKVESLGNLLPSYG